jgi:putative protease
MRRLELLSPARNEAAARAAILNGADAVYIGAPDFGARRAAANSLEEVGRVVELAHRFHARVFVTLNTLLYDDELPAAERLARALYRAGVDALVIQDMALLQLDLPPIALHASTQMHNHDLERVKFLTGWDSGGLSWRGSFRWSRCGRFAGRCRPGWSISCTARYALA